MRWEKEEEMFQRLDEKGQEWKRCVMEL